MKTKSLRYVVSTILVLALFFALAVPSMAVSVKEIVQIYSNQSWNNRSAVTRSGNYSTVLARNHSVYPTSGTDTYENIQCRVTNTSGTTISVNAPHTLNETSATSTTITLGEGYLGYTSIVFGFRGNSSKPGEAVVSYNSR